MQIKIELNGEVLQRLIKVSVSNKRSIPREIEVIILKSFGLWSEKEPSHLEITKTELIDSPK